MARGAIGVGGRLKLPDRARPSFDRGSLAIAAAVDGLGIALETTRFAEAEIARGDLVVLDAPTFKPIEQHTHFLCYRLAERDRSAVVACNLPVSAVAEPTSLHDAR